jgi:ElaA protein
MKLTWLCKKFEDLSNNELYDAMVLRQEVFVLEQNCPYLDADGKDKYSWHVLGYDENNKLAAYARIVFPGISYTEVAIGRVITSQQYRRTGAGKELMRETLKAIENIYGKVSVRISAQTYLVKFYSEFGFVSTGKEYLEDDIPHTEMLR